MRYLGSLIISHWGFHGVLTASIIGRLITLALFAAFVRDPHKTVSQGMITRA